MDFHIALGLKLNTKPIVIAPVFKGQRTLVEEKPETDNSYYHQKYCTVPLGTVVKPQLQEFDFKQYFKDNYAWMIRPKKIFAHELEFSHVEDDGDVHFIDLGCLGCQDGEICVDHKQDRSMVKTVSPNLHAATTAELIKELNDRGFSVYDSPRDSAVCV